MKLLTITLLWFLFLFYPAYSYSEKNLDRTFFNLIKIIDIELKAKWAAQWHNLNKIKPDAEKNKLKKEVISLITFALTPSSYKNKPSEISSDDWVFLIKNSRFQFYSYKFNEDKNSKINVINYIWATDCQIELINLLKFYSTKIKIDSIKGVDDYNCMITSEKKITQTYYDAAIHQYTMTMMTKDKNVTLENFYIDN